MEELLTADDLKTLKDLAHTDCWEDGPVTDAYWTHLGLSGVDVDRDLVVRSRVLVSKGLIDIDLRHDTQWLFHLRPKALELMKINGFVDDDYMPIQSGC